MIGVCMMMGKRHYMYDRTLQLKISAYKILEITYIRTPQQATGHRQQVKNGKLVGERTFCRDYAVAYMHSQQTERVFIICTTHISKTTSILLSNFTIEQSITQCLLLLLPTLPPPPQPPAILRLPSLSTLELEHSMSFILMT